MPDWKTEIMRRLAPLRLEPQREAEIAEELAEHLEDRANAAPCRATVAEGQSRRRGWIPSRH